ncbi:MAG: hypothetical protein ACE5JG_07340, partial [Planctomycetota bacterium]
GLYRFLLSRPGNLASRPVGLEAEPKPFPMGDFDRVVAYHPAAFTKWLSARTHKRPRLVICVASRGRDGRGQRLLDALQLRRLDRAGFSPRAVLVVELSAGRGDAFRLARLFDALQGHLGAVAYWNPGKPPR